MLAIGRKSVTSVGRTYLGNMLNKLNTMIEAQWRDERYHCTPTTNDPRILLEHVLIPPL